MAKKKTKTKKKTPKKYEKIPCLNCGVIFEKKYYNSKYCSEKCKNEFHNKNNKVIRVNSKKIVRKNKLPKTK